MPKNTSRRKVRSSGLRPKTFTATMPPPGEQSSKRTCSLFWLPAAVVGAPLKPCLSFLSGFKSISMNRGRSRTLIRIKTTLCRWMGHRKLPVRPWCGLREQRQCRRSSYHGVKAICSHNSLVSSGNVHARSCMYRFHLTGNYWYVWLTF